MIPRLLLRAFFHLLYTRLAWAYDLVAWMASAGYWYRWVEAALPFLEEGPVLEVGSGRGRLLGSIAAKGLTVVGVDGSPQMAWHSRRASGQPVVCADGRALPFADGHFSALVTTFPAPYILEAETQQEFSRVVRPGGRWVWMDAPTLQPVAGTLLARVVTLVAQGRPSPERAQPEFLFSDRSEGCWDVAVEPIVIGPTTITARVARRIE